MVLINENDDIYSLIRQNNTFAIRLWLDNLTNDIHQRLVFAFLVHQNELHFFLLVMNMALLFFIGRHGMVDYQSFNYYFNEMLVLMPLIEVKYFLFLPSLYSIKMSGDDTPLHLAVSHNHLDIVQQVNQSFICIFS
jgi:hypothetical protein